MTVSPVADTEIVNGVIQGIVQKGTDDYGNPNKWQVEVNVGKQNPRRLWTSDPSLVQQLVPLIGHPQSFLCGKSHWTNNQGQPVTSLWINGVGQPGAVVPQPAVQAQQPLAPPPAAPQLPAPQVMQAPLPQSMPMQQAPVQQPVVQMSPPQSAYISPEVKEERIHRQTATKVASILISHVPAEQRTLDNVLALSERLVAYYENGLAQAVMQNPGGDGYPGDPGAQGVPHTDDDIPF